MECGQPKPAGLNISVINVDGNRKDRPIRRNSAECGDPFDDGDLL